MKWSAKQYQLLRDNQTAAVLGFDDGEVKRQINRVCQATWAGWYERAHQGCCGAPKHIWPMLRLAKKMWREEFRGLLDAADLESLVWVVLKKCLKTFKPEVGDQTQPAQKRFIRRFRYILKRRLQNLAGRRSRRPRRSFSRKIDELEAPSENSNDIGNEYDIWALQLYRLALAELNQRDRQAVEWRARGGKRHELAGSLGVSRKTVTNRYSGEKVVELVRDAVRKIVLGLSSKDLNRLVAHLVVDVELSLEQVGRLLCLPIDGVDVAAVGLEPEEAIRLLTRKRRRKVA